MLGSGGMWALIRRTILRVSHDVLDMDMGITTTDVMCVLRYIHGRRGAGGGEHEIYFNAANLAVAAAKARLAMSLAFAGCDVVLVDDAIGHCGLRLRLLWPARPDRAGGKERQNTSIFKYNRV